MPVFRASNASTENTGWPVPAPRSPYADTYDGPTERLHEPAEPVPESPPPYARRGGVVLAILLAVLALLASAGASLVAWRALGAARSAPGPAAPTSAPSPIASATADVSASPSATAYAVSYAQEPLKVQTGCSSMMYLDLDEPRAAAEEQRSDLRYDSRCGTDAPTLTLAPGAAAGSQVQDSDTDAPGCDRAIRTSPLGSGAGVAVAEGTVLCVLTTGSDGARPRMVLVEVTEVGEDGTAGMRATSWTVP